MSATLLNPQPLIPQVVPTPERSAKLRVVMFSGGSGTRSISESLLRNRQVSLTVIINAYDDGHSTGRLRRFVPGMLGPSDVRKNINRLMLLAEDTQRALRSFSDYRLPDETEYLAARRMIDALAVGDIRLLPAAARSDFERLTLRQASQLYRFFERFASYSEEQEAAGRHFDYRDCALGNIVFAGCYLDEGRDFNRTIEALSAFYQVRGTILNVTGGENLFLVARREDGSWILGEADLVSSHNQSKISELLLIEERTYLGRIEGAEWKDPAELERVLREGARTPQICPATAAALAGADVIVYGPGTQHSSLFPSYMTRGVGEVTAANKKADKIFVSNIRRDCDLPQEDAADIVSKFISSMTRQGEVRADWRDFATRFFFHRPNPEDGSQYIPFDPERLGLPAESLCVRDWESQDGRHTGPYVVNELQRIVQSRIDLDLRPFRHMVSIVVPVLNEARTLEKTLKALLALDFQKWELSKEVIVVDGGSTDGSYEVACSIQGVKACRLEKPGGRGAAMRMGIEKARGDALVFFPADLEYSPEDIYRLVAAISRNEYDAVFGTRNIKCSNLSARLSEIYKNARGLYLLSKYGGMLLSATTLFLYNRYITDPLTCLLAFDAQVLKSLKLEADGLDIQTEIVGKLCRGNRFILEIPVEFFPRTRAEGKKTTPFDGVRAMFRLIRGRYANPVIS